MSQKKCPIATKPHPKPPPNENLPTKPTKPETITSKPTGRVGAEGMMEDEVPTYRSRLEEWKRKAKLEEEKITTQTLMQMQKGKTKAEDMKTAKPADKTARKNRKLPKISCNDTGQQTLRSFMERKKNKVAEREAFSNTCVVPTVSSSETLVGTMTIEAEKSTGTRAARTRDGEI